MNTAINTETQYEHGKVAQFILDTSNDSSFIYTYCFPSVADTFDNITEPN